MSRGCNLYGIAELTLIVKKMDRPYFAADVECAERLLLVKGKKYFEYLLQNSNWVQWARKWDFVGKECLKTCCLFVCILFAYLFVCLFVLDNVLVWTIFKKKKFNIFPHVFLFVCFVCWCLCGGGQVCGGGPVGGGGGVFVCLFICLFVPGVDHSGVDQLAKNKIKYFLPSSLISDYCYEIYLVYELLLCVCGVFMGVWVMCVWGVWGCEVCVFKLFWLS